MTIYLVLLYHPLILAFTVCRKFQMEIYKMKYCLVLANLNILVQHNIITSSLFTELYALFIVCTLTEQLTDF